MIDTDHLNKNPLSRCSDKVLELLDTDYVIDVHCHLFDIKCINKSYFLLRMLKDFLGLKSAEGLELKIDENLIYEESKEYSPGWEDDLYNTLTSNSLQETIYKNNETKGVIDVIKATKFLKMKRMKNVYAHYIDNFSLAISFDLPKENVLTTALMMDLEIGWDTKIRKTFSSQIEELKLLSSDFPILPFLYCDPRRAELKGGDNLYSLFNKAFDGENTFFGIKIYPALGYDPSDYRLWPIYKVCEEFNIPVLSHCGGESVSTALRKIEVYQGKDKVYITGNKRKEVAYKLNDPKRWENVLEKFPKLKLNLAHFGGYETWKSSHPAPLMEDPQQRKETIFGFMRKYENVYADFSYNLVETNLNKSLKSFLFLNDDIADKTLFGTDYWMVNKEGNLLVEQTQFLQSLQEGIEEHNLKERLCLNNPYKYLFQH
ncbi:amidohydrolase family protein [Leeuwenhoekiella sp. H156]|uniref:amidohydrolase family protein n=1 Tax=Leeuwenhoekiella sp. H156 TaxID=3450128 RepID=UPI003FA48068